MPAPTVAPAAKRYDRLDATGEAATAGSWAILGADGGVLTTWEGLRADAATLRLNQTDVGGASQAAAYGSVAEGDIIEWRKADDCWVRYRVTGAPTRPASGSSRQEFPVEWMTYAGTGAGCTGAVGAATVLSVDEAAPSVVRTPGIASPVRHGPFLLIPPGWTGALESQVQVAARPAGASGAAGDDGSSLTWPSGDPAEVRRHPLWSDPDVPTGWTVGSMWAENESIDTFYHNERGYLAARVWIIRADWRPFYVKPLCCNVVETRTIDGRPAVLRYDPEGTSIQVVTIFDEAKGITYSVDAKDPSIRNNVRATIDIARSFYR